MRPDPSPLSQQPPGGVVLPTSIPRLRLRVGAVAEKIIRSSHPWLFAGSIREQNREGQSGELAVIYDRENRFLAIGLFDPDSPLRVRILHVGKAVTLDEAWWEGHLQKALDQRRGLFNENTNGFRWINGENDGWPGLVLDCYGSVLVLKIYTAAWLPRLDSIVGLICKWLKPASLVLRLSRNIQDKARKGHGLTDGQVVSGSPVNGCAVFLENGICFEADVLKGQKTGFFLDQRENRRRVEGFAEGGDVLNAFSFSGGFSLYAARGGAKSVTDLDISEHALEAARRNFRLNQANPKIAACRHETLQTDVFEWLRKNTQRQFQVVIMDPPSLAKRESERTGAVQAYRKLAANGMRLLQQGGVLVAASCSAHVSAEEFFGAVREAAAQSGRRFRELETTMHPPDHAATFPEGQYLKCIYLKAT